MQWVFQYVASEPERRPRPRTSSTGWIDAHEQNNIALSRRAALRYTKLLFKVRDATEMAYVLLGSVVLSPITTTIPTVFVHRMEKRDKKIKHTMHMLS